MSAPTPARIASLADIEAAIWSELARAAVDKRHDWRTPVLASNDGTRPDARTVVLREVNVTAHTLVVYSDARAPKVRQLRIEPRCTFVMWSARLRWQVRLQAVITVHTDGLAVTSRWALLRATPAALDYLAPQAPGELLAPQSPREPPAARAKVAAQREHFAVLSARVEAVDWLSLESGGHRRARFEAGAAHWLAA